MIYSVSRDAWVRPKSLIGGLLARLQMAKMMPAALRAAMSKLRVMLGRHPRFDDAEWFELQLDPATAKARYGVDLPGFPDEATQITFTGSHGRPNLEEAFSFYLHARAVSGIHKLRGRLMYEGPVRLNAVYKTGTQR